LNAVLHPRASLEIELPGQFYIDQDLRIASQVSARATQRFARLTQRAQHL
jgi:hypothetical protein